jgi:hypothetical protein
MGAQSPGNVPRERHSTDWRCRRVVEIGVPGDRLHRQRPLGIIYFPWVIRRQGHLRYIGQNPRWISLGHSVFRFNPIYRKKKISLKRDLIS